MHSIKNPAIKKAANVSVLKTMLLFVSITLLNALPILVCLGLLGFNDSGATFTIWSGFKQSLKMMLFPLLWYMPGYIVGYWISRELCTFFHPKVYVTGTLMVLVATFSIYWYVFSSVY